MNYRLVCKRFLQAFCLAFGVLFAVYALRGQAAPAAALDAAVWALLSAGVYAAVLARKLRRHPACAVARD